MDPHFISLFFFLIYYFFYNIVLTVVRGNNHNLGNGNLYLQLKEEKKASIKVLLNLIAKIYIFVEGRSYERCIEKHLQAICECQNCDEFLKENA